MTQSSEDGSRTDRVMVDIETLGTETGSVILSIGAVHFYRDGLGEEFHRSVSLSSCQEHGLSIDADTLEWWLGQDDDVQGILSGGNSLSRVLFEFTDFYGDADEIWAFSPSFDCEMLAHAYDAIGETEPWSYRDERDCRTLVELPGAVELEQRGDAHDALDDAKYQARTVIATLGVLEEAVGGER